MGVYHALRPVIQLAIRHPRKTKKETKVFWIQIDELGFDNSLSPMIKLRLNHPRKKERTLTGTGKTPYEAVPQNIVRTPYGHILACPRSMLYDSSFQANNILKKIWCIWVNMRRDAWN